jgi:hypothetical protein
MQNVYMHDAEPSLTTPRQRMYCLGISVGFLSPSTQAQRHYRKLGHDYFLACAFELFSRYHLTIQHCTITVTESCITYITD